MKTEFTDTKSKPSFHKAVLKKKMPVCTNTVETTENDLEPIYVVYTYVLNLKKKNSFHFSIRTRNQWGSEPPTRLRTTDLVYLIDLT